MAERASDKPTTIPAAQISNPEFSREAILGRVFPGTSCRLASRESGMARQVIAGQSKEFGNRRPVRGPRRQTFLSEIAQSVKLIQFLVVQGPDELRLDIDLISDLLLFAYG